MNLRTPSRLHQHAVLARRRIVGGALLALGAVAGCDGDAMTVGTPPSPVQTSSAIQPGDVYTGYVERWQFASGSDRLSLTFTSPTAGTVWFGAPPDASEAELEPAVGYPAWARSLIGQPGVPSEILHRESERFLFTMRDVSFEAERVRFTIDFHEIWGKWCTLQQSHPQFGPQEYRCAPPRTVALSSGCGFYETDPDDKFGTPILGAPLDCGFINLCKADACTCDATSCRASLGKRILHFDMRLDGRKVDGSTELGNLRLEKQ
jgi:hypothetical protein